MLCVEVYSMVFEGKEYVIISDCPGPDEMACFYDCNGNKKCEFGGIMGGYGSCSMPPNFTIEYYFAHRKHIFTQDPNLK